MIGARPSTAAQGIDCVAALTSKAIKSALRGRKKAPMAFPVGVYISKSYVRLLASAVH